jgi:hypothetical protein
MIKKLLISDSKVTVLGCTALYLAPQFQELSQQVQYKFLSVYCNEDC